MALYRITHQTTYRHAAPASVSWQALRVHPRSEPGQECLEFELEITPRPAEITTGTDYFGNVVHAFSVGEAHHDLAIDVKSLVRRSAPPLPMPALTPTPKEAAAQVQAAIASGQFELEQYLHASPHVPLLPEARTLVEGIPGDTPVLNWIEAVGQRFSEQFAFDTRVTSVSTPLADVLAARRGVCQDFAHAFASCVRQHGLPAAYVSGYLLTHPPPGQPRLLGADAMHAWVSIFVPGTGWVDYDPTNHIFIGTGHIVIARGRDYADVSPVRGVFKGGGVHTLFLGVTVEPADESA